MMIKSDAVRIEELSITDTDLEGLPEEEDSEFSDTLWEMAAKEIDGAVAMDEYFERRGIY